MQSDETSVAPPCNAEQTHNAALLKAQTLRAKELLPVFVWFHVERQMSFDDALAAVNEHTPQSEQTLAILRSLCERRMQRFNKRKQQHITTERT